MRMEVKEIRQRNVFELAEYFGREDLAEMLGYPDAGYLNQIARGASKIGDRTARKIEKVLGKPVGWLDHLHDDSPALELIKLKIAEYNLSDSEAAEIVDYIDMLAKRRERRQ